MKSKGFTLIEILVVISITAILGVIFTSTLVQILRGQNKVRVLNQVKQNGQVVLNRLSNEIRQAEKIICVGDVGDSRVDNSDTIVIFKQGIYTRFRFYPPTGSKNGYIAWDNPAEEALACSADQIFPLIPLPTSSPAGMAMTVLDVSPSPSPTPVPLSIAKYLTDTDPVNGISLNYAGGGDFTDKIFKQDYKAGFSDMITIKFKVTAGVGAGQTYETSVGEGGILFTTTVGVKGGR